MGDPKFARKHYATPPHPWDGVRISEENQIILMVDPAASAFTTGKYFNPYVFRTGRTNYDDTLVIAKYLVENVGSKFAHIGIDNA